MAYEHVHIEPDGDSSLDEITEVAEICGYSGLVIRNHHDSMFEQGKEDLESSIDVHWGVEIHTDDIDVMHGLSSKYREMDRYPVYLHGGDKRMNRAGINSSGVDVLCHPLRKGLSGFDHVLAEKAEETGTVIELNLSDVIRSSEGSRVNALRGLGLLMDLQRKYGFRYILSSDAFNHRQIRSKRGLMALCGLIGLSEEEVKMGLHETPAELLNR